MALRLLSILFGFPASVSAANTVCPLQGFLPELGCAAGGVGGLRSMIAAQIPVAEDIFLGIMILMFMVYALSLIIGSHDESAVTESRKAFTYALIGSGIVFAKRFIYGAVEVKGGGSGSGSAIINITVLNPIFEQVLTYLQVIAAGAAIGFVTVRAIQLILAGSDEGSVSSQRKLLINAVVGVGVVVMARLLVLAALPESGGILPQEARGVALYILYILGVLLVLGIIIGGAMLVLSYDEGLQERAKKSIFASVIVLIVLICTGALVTLFSEAAV